MKLLKLLNKKNLSILISFFFLQNSYSVEPVDIWKTNNQKTNESTIIENETIQLEESIGESIFQINSEKDIFVAIKGEHDDGHKYINAVLDRAVKEIRSKD